MAWKSSTDDCGWKITNNKATRKFLWKFESDTVLPSVLSTCPLVKEALQSCREESGTPSQLLMWQPDGPNYSDGRVFIGRNSESAASFG